MSATFVPDTHAYARGDEIVVRGYTWVVSGVKADPVEAPLVRLVRKDGRDELILTAAELKRDGALLNATRVEVPALISTPPRGEAEGVRSVHFLRERRAEVARDMLELTKQERALSRRLSLRDAQLRTDAYSDKSLSNDKSRDAAYKTSLTSDTEYITTQGELDAVQDALAELQIEADVLRREARIAEIDYEADRLGRRLAA